MLLFSKRLTSFETVLMKWTKTNDECRGSTESLLIVGHLQYGTQSFFERIDATAYTISQKRKVAYQNVQS